MSRVVLGATEALIFRVRELFYPLIGGMTISVRISPKLWDQRMQHDHTVPR